MWRCQHILLQSFHGPHNTVSEWTTPTPLRDKFFFVYCLENCKYLFSFTHDWNCSESNILLNMNFKRVTPILMLTLIFFLPCLTDRWIFSSFSFEIASGLQQHPYLSSQGKVVYFSDFLSGIISFEIFTFWNL